ncbi:ribosomal protein S18-alanine N-acetyltransferase [Halopseudomonas phragmitis]|uniref:[Ribosomal protein bS18]-alanine N-acetyltransferase n=2 Tax=Pseudomonadaceae TaxID=135621 RepID=A0A1V0B0U0_9GAMM|nr:MULTISPECIES: ribosomal protein S18-alanine N-acetyltransferase [Pseudomonadaceae]AQZ93556.1 ribosomal-protein-alanine N-acetyltransferase [Halopseudomonas phragmitis]RHW19753.1 ribosomal-protein-alanine N-acetyltransferase [Pseudomonas jilinensis]
MSAVRFRPMTEADIDAVLKVEFAAFSHPWTRGIFLDCLKSGYECWLMFAGDQQVGHGVLMTAGDESHLLNITVKPENQGNGLGLQLLEHLMQQARARQAEVAFLEVRESNQSAFRLYERFGFNEIGRRKGYYPAVGGREDALVMAYSLLD